VANADTVTLAQRTTLNGTTVGSEGKPVSKLKCVTTKITRLIADDDKTPTRDPRLDKKRI
jgi:hypothetical protein